MIKEIVEATIKECYPKFRSVTTLQSDFEIQVFNKVRQQVKNQNIPAVSNLRELLIAYTLKMLSCTDEQAETMVDSYLSLSGVINLACKREQDCSTMCPNNLDDCPGYEPV